MKDPLDRVKKFFKIKENIYHKEGPTGINNHENEKHLSINIKEFTVRKGIILFTVATLVTVGIMNGKAKVEKEKTEYDNAVLVGKLSVDRQNLADGINPPSLADMAERVQNNNFSQNPVKKSLSSEDLGQSQRLGRAINSATHTFNKLLNEKGVSLPKEIDQKTLDNAGKSGTGSNLIDQTEEQRLEALRKRLGMIKR